MQLIKKTIIVVFCLCFILPCVFIFNGCSARQNYDGLVIKNWTSYEAIGAGFVNQEVVGNSNNVSLSNQVFAASDIVSSKLIGLKKDGTYENIAYISNDGDTS